MSACPTSGIAKFNHLVNVMSTRLDLSTVEVLFPLFK